MRYLVHGLLIATLIVLPGCVRQAAPKAGGPAIQGVIGQGPVSEVDLPLVERLLAEQMKLHPDRAGSLQIRQTAHTRRVSYVLYSLPNQDGLAVVTKQGPDIRILERIPIPPGDPVDQLVTYNTIIAGNPWDPDHGVLFGRVHNPYIKSIEARFRDTTTVKTDVSQSRSFLIIRPGTDTRFVQINAVGDGGLWWTKDMR